MENYIINKCRWCGRKMKSTTKDQGDYNLKKHEDACLFKDSKKEVK